MNALEWVGLGAVVFAGAAAYEWTIAQYVRAEREARALAMANWSVATTAIGLMSLLGILAVSMWFLLPELAGVWAGSYAAGRRRITASITRSLRGTSDSVDEAFAPRFVQRDPRRSPEQDRRLGFRGPDRRAG